MLNTVAESGAAEAFEAAADQEAARAAEESEREVVEALGQRFDAAADSAGDERWSLDPYPGPVSSGYPESQQMKEERRRKKQKQPPLHDPLLAAAAAHGTHGHEGAAHAAAGAPERSCSSEASREELERAVNRHFVVVESKQRTRRGPL